MQNNLYDVHNWSGSLKRQQNTCFRGSQAALFLLFHVVTQVMQTGKRQLFLSLPQHWAVPLALQPSPLLKVRMLPAATHESLQLCRAVLLSLALLQPPPRGWRKLSPPKVSLLSCLVVPPALWHRCVILEIGLWWAFVAIAEHCHTHQYCCVNLIDHVLTAATLKHHPSASVLKCCKSLRTEMDLCPRSGKKTRKMDLPYFSTWTQNRGFASTAKFCVIWCRDDYMFAFPILLIVLFHTPEWGKHFLDSEHHCSLLLYQTMLTGWHLKSWAAHSRGFSVKSWKTAQCCQPWLALSLIFTQNFIQFQRAKQPWIKHKSQPVFDVPHVCFARSLSWDWNQSAETRSCTGWQKQQKDELLLREKPHVVNVVLVEVAVFHLDDLCIQLNFWGELKKSFVVKKTRLSLCSSNIREAE